MARLDSFTCDTCGAVKGPANHWLMGKKMSGTLAVTTHWCYGIGKWNSVIEDVCDHFCGMECALKRLNEFLEAKKCT